MLKRFVLPERRHEMQHAGVILVGSFPEKRDVSKINFDLLIEHFLLLKISQVQFVRLLKIRLGDVERFGHRSPEDRLWLH